LDGRSVARGRLAAGTGGELRAEIDSSGSGGWGVVRSARVQARLGRRTGGKTGKPTAQIKPKSILARITNACISIWE